MRNAWPVGYSALHSDPREGSCMLKRCLITSHPSNSKKKQKTAVCLFFSLFHGLDLIKEVLCLDDEIHNLAKELYQQKSVLIMGRGYHYATCLEGALVSRDIDSNTGFSHSLWTRSQKKKKSWKRIFNFLTTQGGEMKHWV